MIRIYIGIGQSNMDGRGVLAQSPIYEHAARIFVYAKDSILKPAVEPVTSSVNCTYAPFKDSASAVGPLMSFANRMAELHPDDIIVIVPCSKGSTSISQWRPIPSPANLYGATIARVKEAIAAAKDEFTGETVKLCGALWWQFEAETQNATLAAGWREKWGEWVSRFRVDVGDLNLPIVFARANNLSHPNHTSWAAMRTYHNGVYIPGVAMADVDSPAVQYQTDRVHATTAGYVVAGEIMGNEMNGLELALL